MLRTHHLYFYDNCENQWFSEDAVTPNARPGDRMIRANGFPLSALTVVAYRSDSADVTSASLTWTSVGAPYYHIYSSLNVSGPFDVVVGSIPSAVPTGQPVTFTDVNAVNLGLKKYYRVFASDIP